METTVSAETNSCETVAITEIERAYFAERLLAAFVDNLLVRMPLVLLTIILWMPLLRSQTYLSVRFLIGVLAIGVELVVVVSYFAGYAYTQGGQTLGKKWNVIKVTDLKGCKLTLTHFICREFIARGIPVIAALFVGNWANLWLLTYLFSLTKDRRALHDIIAQTQVIRA